MITLFQHPYLTKLITGVRQMIDANIGSSDITIMSDFLSKKYLHFEDSEEMAWGSVVSWLSRLRLLEEFHSPYCSK